jgi:formate dehydrogenase subunit delta
VIAAMEADKLVKMANQIGSFFDSEPERTVALESIAGHIRRFWEPRMRRALLRWVDEHHGEGLTDSVQAAIGAHREKLSSGL